MKYDLLSVNHIVTWFEETLRLFEAITNKLKQKCNFKLVSHKNVVHTTLQVMNDDFDNCINKTMFRQKHDTLSKFIGCYIPL